MNLEKNTLIDRCNNCYNKDKHKCTENSLISYKLFEDSHGRPVANCDTGYYCTSWEPKGRRK